MWFKFFLFFMFPLSTPDDAEGETRPQAGDAPPQIGPHPYRYMLDNVLTSFQMIHLPFFVLVNKFLCSKGDVSF